MKSKRATEAVVVGAVVLLLLWEGWTVVAIPGGTISEFVWQVIAHQPIVIFLSGLLCGHWFWQRSGGTK